MPHKVTEDDDDDLLNRVLREEQLDALENIHSRALDIGEKANDAEDFEDIGDEDLPEEEDVVIPGLKSEYEEGGGNLDEEQRLEEDPLDDLFNSNDNDFQSSPPPGGLEGDAAPSTTPLDAVNNVRARSQSQDSFTADETFYTQEQEAVKIESVEEAVSYTHLTLPTIYSV